MANPAPNARSFLDAFASIEDVLSEQQGWSSPKQKRHKHDEQWTGFSDLVRHSTTLLESQKRELRAFARLRNAIVHSSYRNGAPIADPHNETVESILKIYNALVKPTLLREALRTFAPPKVFAPDDDINTFLSLVTDYSFSQAPVRTDSGFDLITTNAVARWFAFNLNKHGGLVDSAPVETVLEYAERGDRLRSVPPDTTVVSAIRLLAGQNDNDIEPPTALLLLGAVGQPPQRLCSRADLPLFYEQLEA